MKLASAYFSRRLIMVCIWLAGSGVLFSQEAAPPSPTLFDAPPASDDQTNYEFVEPVFTEPSAAAQSSPGIYDRGMVLKFQEGDDSFELKTNLRMQFRATTFTPFQNEWTDNAGIVRPIDERQTFDIERARLIFAGHAFTPKLRYFLQMDGDTDRGNYVTFLDYWWSWKFSESVEVQFGKRKVSGTRNWQLGAFDTRLADRSFATDFFRPGRTTGIWLVGTPRDNMHYELMVGQGYRTDNLSPQQVSDQFAVAGDFWWDVVGDYGPARPTDFEFHPAPAVRIGTSVVESKEGQLGTESPEADFLRLSDGTRLTQRGALAPNATVQAFKVTLLTFDAAYKYRGWSANAEYFLRWVNDIQADMPVPNTELFQHGFYFEGGHFVTPQLLEWNVQYAFVTGEFGVTNSYAAGFSYYPRMTQYLKLAIDVTYIDGSPVNSTGSDILVGDNGVLLRLQCQALF